MPERLFDETVRSSFNKVNQQLQRHEKQLQSDAKLLQRDKTTIKTYKLSTNEDVK